MIFNILSFISLAIFVDAVALKSNPKVISFDFELRFSDPIKEIPTLVLVLLPQ